MQRAKIGRLMMICLLATVSCELDKVCTVQGSILRCIRMSREMKCEDVGEKLSSADWPVLLASKTEMSIFMIYEDMFIYFKGISEYLRFLNIMFQNTI